MTPKSKQSWIVTYQCIEDAGEWGSKGNVVKIRFDNLDIENIESYHPGGWVIKSIENGNLTDESVSRGTQVISGT